MRLPPVFGNLTPAPSSRLSCGGSWSEDPLSVSRGQATFDAEGSEQMGRYFSRRIHWPGGQSGVTIGRGYDMGQRTPLQVQRELVSAGVPEPDAIFLSTAAGLRGQRAERFVFENAGSAPVLEPLAQKRLFERITTVEVIGDIRRILAKPDTIARYGHVEWSELPAPIQDLVFDLRYRGDYTPATRELIQDHIVKRDFGALTETMANREYWKSQGVPDDRFQRRLALLEGHIPALRAA